MYDILLWQLIRTKESATVRFYCMTRELPATFCYCSDVVAVGSPRPMTEALFPGMLSFHDAIFMFALFDFLQPRDIGCQSWADNFFRFHSCYKFLVCFLVRHHFPGFKGSPPFRTTDFVRRLRILKNRHRSKLRVCAPLSIL
jgi:hypothetical protein